MGDDIPTASNNNLLIVGPPTPEPCLCSTVALSWLIRTNWDLDFGLIPYIIFIAHRKGRRWMGDTGPFESGLEFEHGLAF